MKLLFLLIVSAALKQCTKSPVKSYPAGMVRDKFKRVNDSLYYNQYKKIYLVKRGGRFYPC